MTTEATSEAYEEYRNANESWERKLEKFEELPETGATEHPTSIRDAFDQVRRKQERLAEALGELEASDPQTRDLRRAATDRALSELQVAYEAAALRLGEK